MPRLAADHNFDARIVAGLMRRKPDLEIVRIRDRGLSSAPDAIVLEWAAEEGRILLTHDRATLLGLAYERVARGEQMSGIIAVGEQCPIRCRGRRHSAAPGLHPRRRMGGPRAFRALVSRTPLYGGGQPALAEWGTRSPPATAHRWPQADEHQAFLKLGTKTS